MVSTNFLLPLLGLVASITPLASGAALRHEESTSTLFRRITSDTSTWDKYHRVNGDFARLGFCMSYIDPTDRDGTWACGQFCNNDFTRVCFAPAEASSREYLINKNPNGERWVLGECHCNSGADKLAELLVDFTAKGLEEGFGQLLKLSCQVTLDFLKEAAFVGAAFIPGAGPAVATARAMAKGVKLASKTTGGKDIWMRTVEVTCGVFDNRQEFSQGYDAWLAANVGEE